ncbi:hypothetical protein [Metabacillus flavus]|nr:hypothetical protein [Metabacillus flavus]
MKLPKEDNFGEANEHTNEVKVQQMEKELATAFIEQFFEFLFH